MFRTFSALGLAAALSLTAVSASAMEAKQTIEREVSVTLEDGSVMTRREPAALVKPGDSLIYTLDFVNTQSEAVSNINMAMPVPAEVRFVETADAMGAAQVSYSADGGQTYGATETLRVVGADGQSRVATNDDITHVRWTINRSIEAGEQGMVAFRGELR